jgi:hypothetical protein
MSESSIVAPFTYLVEEPPLSPSAPPVQSLRPYRLEPLSPVVELVPEPEPKVDEPSVDTQLRCYRLLASEQMAQALREGVVTGKSVVSIALAHGWVTKQDLAREEREEQEPATVTVMPTDTESAVFLRLSNGERILVDRFPSKERATSEARQLSVRMGRENEWPLINDRCVRPEAVVSIDVEKLS